MLKILGWVAKATGWLVLLAVVGFCGVATFGNAPFKAERDRERRIAATQMVDALEAHRAAKGGYPERLEGLVPRYLPVLPDFDGGGSLTYRRAKNVDSFELSYPEAPYGGLPTDGFWIYQSSAGDWDFVVY